MQSCKALSFRWISPTRFSSASLGVCIERQDDVCDDPNRFNEKIKAKNDFMHSLREVLREALGLAVATARPRDFSGLGALHLSKSVGKSFYELICRPAGPSLIAGGQWTACRAARAGLCDTTCPRCGADRDGMEHRCWGCPDNDYRRHELLAQTGLSLNQIIALPACFRRCGIPTASLV